MSIAPEGQKEIHQRPDERGTPISSDTRGKFLRGQSPWLQSVAVAKAHGAVASQEPTCPLETTAFVDEPFFQGNMVLLGTEFYLEVLQPFWWDGDLDSRRLGIGILFGKHIPCNTPRTCGGGVAGR